MIGRILGNRYEIIEQIGEGGMAIVYKAKCHLLNRFVAVKVLRDEFTNDEEFIRKFRRESQAAASLSHPNILNIYDVGNEEIDNKSIHYIVMEYIDGNTLKELIKSKGKLSPSECVNYSLQIAEALQHAHRNHIVHRDIKPHNIMITKDNRVKVTDFGIARAVTSSTVTTSSNVLGSVHYFSPEQARGGYTDEKSDIYSLGIVMYEMVTGKVPYDGESPISVALKHIQEEIKPPREIDQEVPISIETIILKCVQKRQGDRYSNISDLIRDLKGVKNLDITTKIDNELDSATRIIPVIDIEDDDELEAKSKKRKKTNDNISKKAKKKKSDGGGLAQLLGIVMAFILATGMFIGYSKLKDYVKIEEITVPEILRMQEEDAKAAIEKLNLVFKVTDRVKSNEFKKGEVMYQSVEPDTKVREGYPINVTISEGADLVTVPLIINKTLADGEASLKDSGLKVGTVDPAFSPTVPKGSIIKQDPDALSSVPPGSRVNIIISQGPEVTTVIMPNLANTPINEAKNTILGLDLVIGDITPQPSDNIAKDLVIWQSYEQGTELETGTAVDLYISSGPAETEPSADEEVPTTLTMSPSQDKEETEILIYRIQDGITIPVYNKKHKASDGDFVITLYSKVGARFDIYYDGIFRDSWTVAEPAM